MPVSSGISFAFDWEVALIEWLQTHLAPGLITFISYLSMFGEEIIMIAVLGFLYWAYDKKLGREVGLTLLVANVWNPLIKNIVLRRRPYFDNEGIQILRVVDPDADIYDIAAQGYSFPSGHSSGSMSLYGSLFAFGKDRPLTDAAKRILLILAIVLPLLVGFSRITVGAHYPTDVLCGYALGLLVIFIVRTLIRRMKNQYLLFLILLLTAVPGFFYCESDDFYTGTGMLLGFILAVPFEAKYVDFENTRSPIRSILRVIGGGAIYVILNTLLKVPFSSEFLESGTLAAHLVRTFRYAIILFVDMGVYPMMFKVTAAVGRKPRELMRTSS